MKKLSQRRRRRKREEGTKLHWELCLPRLLLIRSSSSTGHNATGCSLGLTRELNWTEVCLVQSVFSDIRYIQTCGTSRSLYWFSYMRSVTESVFACVPQQAGEQKSWTSVELLAWDTPVCISPHVCQSCCTQILLGLFQKLDDIFLFLYFIK